MWAGRDKSGIGVPAYCPELLAWAGRRQQQLKLLARRPEATALELLGLDGLAPGGKGTDIAGSLTREQEGNLNPGGKTAALTRWQQTWETAGRELSRQHRSTIRRYQERTDPDVARTARNALLGGAAAQLDRWVRLSLLPQGYPVVGLRRVIGLHNGVVRGEKSERSAHAQAMLKPGSSLNGIDPEVLNGVLEPARVDPNPGSPSRRSTTGRSGSRTGGA